MRRVQSARNVPTLNDIWSSLFANENASREFVLVISKLKELQIEVVKLKQKLKESEAESYSTIVFSRRAVLFSNIILALITLIGRSADAFQKKAYVRGTFGNLFVPQVLAGKSSGYAQIYHSFLRGSSASLPFTIGFAFLQSNRGGKRNLGFAISSIYSLYLAFGEGFIPFLNCVSVLLNLMYLIARHYYLHGLLSCGWVSHLH